MVISDNFYLYTINIVHYENLIQLKHFTLISITMIPKQKLEMTRFLHTLKYMNINCNQNKTQSKFRKSRHETR